MTMRGLLVMVTNYNRYKNSVARPTGFFVGLFFVFKKKKTSTSVHCFKISIFVVNVNIPY